jgi:hypothetical protein
MLLTCQFKMPSNRRQLLSLSLLGWGIFASDRLPPLFLMSPNVQMLIQVNPSSTPKYPAETPLSESPQSIGLTFSIFSPFPAFCFLPLYWNWQLPNLLEFIWLIPMAIGTFPFTS